MVPISTAIECSRTKQGTEPGKTVGSPKLHSSTSNSNFRTTRVTRRLRLSPLLATRRERGASCCFRSRKNLITHRRCNSSCRRCSSSCGFLRVANETHHHRSLLRPLKHKTEHDISICGRIAFGKGLAGRSEKYRDVNHGWACGGKIG